MKIGFVAISFMQKPSLISPNKRIGYPFLLKLLSRRLFILKIGWLPLLMNLKRSGLWVVSCISIVSNSVHFGLLICTICVLSVGTEIRVATRQLAWISLISQVLRMLISDCPSLCSIFLLCSFLFFFTFENWIDLYIFRGRTCFGIKWVHLRLGWTGCIIF